MHAGPGPFAATTGSIVPQRPALRRRLAQRWSKAFARAASNRTPSGSCGDHGEAFGQHQGNYGHTFLLYDENVRVPLLIAAPGRMHSQERVRKVVSLVDIAPTILALLGVPPPSNYQGASMLDGTPRMALFFADYSLGLCQACARRPLEVI
jgi:hypothetical protein